MTTLIILASLLVLAIALVIYLARKANREAQFEADEAIRAREAATNRQEWIAGIMQGYNAPVPTENVPRFENNPDEHRN